MKQKWQQMLAIVVIVSACAPAAGAVNFTVGANYWPSTWSISSFPVLVAEGWQYGDVYGEDHWENASSLDITGAGLYGVNGLITFNSPWGIGFTLLRGSFDFEIDQTFTAQIGNVTSTTLYQLEFGVDRTDLDLALNYRLNNNFTAFLGYKSLSYSYGEQTMLLSQTHVAPWGRRDDVPAPQQIASYEINYHGPGVGIAGSLPFGPSGLVFLGSVSFLPYFMAVESGRVDKLSDDTGWAVNAETGFAYVPGNMPFFGRLSFRYQRFDGFAMADVDMNENQNFQGPLLLVGVRF